MTHTLHRYGDKDYAVFDSNLNPVMKVKGFIEAVILTNYLNGGSGMDFEHLAILLMDTVEAGHGHAWSKEERQKYLEWFKSTEMDRMVARASAAQARRS